MIRRYAVAKALFAFTRHLQPITQRSLSARYRPAARWPRRVLRSTAARHSGGGRSLNLATLSLAPLESASTRRGLLSHAMTALKFGARFLSITRFYRSGGAGLRSRRRSRPLWVVPLRGTGGHPSVVAGWRDMDVRASRRRSARSQGRRRAVKQGCPSVARAKQRAL